MGGFESHIVAHPNIMFKYNQITPEEATLTEPLSCVTHSVDTAGIKLGEMVLVIGCGTMGLLHTMLSVKKGASVIVSDMNEERLKLAQKLGAKYIINPSKEDLEQRIMEITDGKKVQVIFDTTPVAEVVEDACKVLSNNGRLVLYSSFYPDKPVTFSPDWIHKSGVKIMGTANSNTQDFVKATSMLSEGIINIKDLISEVYPVDQAKQALESAAKGDKFRVIITF
jgi:2-desacetyl-2-hydroxyethyl bacteriochlorophyllide A dehydrogenase